MPATLRLDPYLVDVLMPDLVGHDRQPSAFVLYLYLWRRTGGRRDRTTVVSLQEMAVETGLSKSAVQAALRLLLRRRLITRRQASITAVPEYGVATPWRRD